MVQKLEQGAKNQWRPQQIYKLDASQFFIETKVSMKVKKKYHATVPLRWVDRRYACPIHSSNKFNWLKAVTLWTFLLFVGCLLVDNIVDKAIKPRYMQEGLDLSILVIILSILFWSWVLGPTGAILSVPLTMMVKKLVLESSEETRFIALLMGAGNTEKVTNNHSASEDENG